MHHAKDWGLAVVLLGTLGCTMNPATGERQFNVVPRSQEIALGKQAAEEVVQSVGLYENPRLQKYVADMGARLAAVSENPDLPWTFQVVDDSAVNAFALPGGPIFVTRGLLANLNNEAQVAAVVGHEIGHVTGRHSANQMSKAMFGQLALGAAMIVSDTARQFGQLGMAGLQVLFLKFGRDHERQADELGFRYAIKGNYDVRQMPAVFTTLKRVGDLASKGSSGGRLPEWMSTHPDPEQRAEDAVERIAKTQIDPKAEVDEDQHMAVIEGIEYGPNPRQGFFQGDSFLHPEMKFTLAFPSGWQKANLKQAVISAPPGEQQDAAIQLTLAEKNASPAQALQAFMAQKGVKEVAGGAAGLPPNSAAFTATTEQGEIAGLVTFLAHAGNTFQFVSLTVPAKLSNYASTFARVHGSFAPLTDPAALNVQPARLVIERAPRAMTLEQLYRERPTGASLAAIAVMNQLEPSSSLAAGHRLKWVKGTVHEQGGAAVSAR
jgi:predicted Zn-dependent protease